MLKVALTAMRHVPIGGCARGHRRTVRWSPDGAPVPTVASSSGHWRILQWALENRLVPNGRRTLRGIFNRLSASNRKELEGSPDRVNLNSSVGFVCHGFDYIFSQLLAAGLPTFRVMSAHLRCGGWRSTSFRPAFAARRCRKEAVRGREVVNTLSRIRIVRVEGGSTRRGRLAPPAETRVLHP